MKFLLLSLYTTINISGMFECSLLTLIILQIVLPVEELELHSPTEATEDEKTFCEIFNLPLTESPLPGVYFLPFILLKVTK